MGRITLFTVTSLRKPAEFLPMKIAIFTRRSSNGRKRWSSRLPACAFTLIELLVSVTFLVVLMLVITEMLGLVQRTWVRTNSRVSQFREARMAFDALSRNLGQAVLNTYWDTPSSSKAGQIIAPAPNYVRTSELQFVCGPATYLFPSLPGGSGNYPGHGVFFQAPLGITNLTSSDENQTTANTENMTSLLCGRGYFVQWGDDTSFRPAFLANNTLVPLRFRYRLMEYSPTAEMNQIYNAKYKPITQNSRQWFQDAVQSKIVNGENSTSRAFTRSIAENILALIISPQIEVPPGGTGVTPTSIAPNYIYDSTLVSNPGATVGGGNNSQGTQHLLPPLIQVTMIALDQVSGETLASNSATQQAVSNVLGGLFQQASSFSTDLHKSDGTQGQLEKVLRAQKLNFRVFTTMIPIKQSRWSL